MIARAILLLALVAISGGAAGQDLEAVRFPGPGGLELAGYLARPDGPGPFPAVVALHGCGGLHRRDGTPDARSVAWGRHLARAGLIVLFPDSFGSRGLGSQCRVAERTVRPRRERVADADAAKLFLQGRPDVRADAVSLLGWSNGGSSVLYGVEPGARGTNAGPDFRAAVAFYPGCRAPAEHGWRTRLPLLVLVGEADDWTGAEPCRSMIEEAKARGEPASIVVYPGAVHDFDAPDRPVRERRDLAYTAGGTGRARTGTDPLARADAMRRVPDFLLGR